MPGVVRLLCVHQNRLFRQLLVSVFSATEGFDAVEIDSGSPEFLRQVHSQQPHVLLVDVGLPERRAVGVTSFVAKHLPDTKLIFLIPGTELTEPIKRILVECLEVGTHGFLLEESSMDELRMAIGKVVAGQKYFATSIVETMFAELTVLSRESRWRQRVQEVSLTEREKGVLALIAEGLSNKQVAEELSLSLYTVKNHVHNILDKLQVEDRYEAVMYALENRWLTPTARTRFSTGFHLGPAVMSGPKE